MKKLLFLFTIASLAATLSFAQKETPPEGGKAKDFKLSERKKQTYKNGLQTTLVQYGNTPKATISLIIKTGNIHENKDQIWLADLVGRLLREGSKTADFTTLSKKAAMMGGSLNISVGLSQTTITGNVLSEYAPEFIRLISDILVNPAFPEKELDRLKGDLRRQLVTQKGVPQQLAQEQFYQAVYGDQRVGITFPTEEMINSYTTKQVRDFYNANFGAKRAVLYVVGQFDEKAVNAAVSGSLAKWKAGPSVKYPEVTARPTGDTLIINRDKAPQTTVVVGLPVIRPNNKDYLPMLVANSLLGGSFGSRITRNIREDKGYTYSPFSTVANNTGGTLWYEQADVTSEHTVASLQEIEKEIKQLQAIPPAGEELQGIQNYEAGIFVLRNSSPAGIIGQLNFLDLYGLDDSYLGNYVKNIHSVTPEQISELTRNYIDYDKMTKILVGDKATIEQQIKTQQEKLKAF